MKRARPIVLAIICFALQGAAASAERATFAEADGRSPASSGDASGAAASVQQVRASKLLGTTVYDSKRSALGEISDLILDTGTGRVH